MIVAAGAPEEPKWPLPPDAPRVLVDAETLVSARPVIEVLQRCWSERRRVVVELDVEREELAAPESFDGPVHELDPSFEFARERLYFLIRANNYDARTYPPRWGPALNAERLGAEIGGPADVILSDGTPVYCDGGPRGPLGFHDGGQANGMSSPALIGEGAEAPNSVSLAHSIAHITELGAGRITIDGANGYASVAVESRGEGVGGDGLAADQLRAVKHHAGPARIIAPAGSGKTHVLTARLRHLVAGRGWSPAAITALAYNRKAADEMRLRLAGTSAAGCVRTLHAFGYQILTDAAGGEAPRLIDEMERRRRVERLVDVRHRANADVLAPFLDALGAVRLGLRDPESVEAESDEIDGFASMFDKYRAGLARDRVIDFDEQIYGSLEVLVRNSAIRRAAQQRCRHMLIDEFQDLTAAQMLMVRLLGAPAYDVFGVGDDDQTIYGYQGADPGYLIDFGRYFPGAAEHALATNYRCPPEIVSAADRLLSYNTRRVKKEIHAGRSREPGRAVGMRMLSAAPSRAPGIALDVIRAWIADGVDPNEIAVLARVNSLLLAPHVLLADAGVGFRSDLGSRVLERTGARTALGYLRLAADVAAGRPLDRRDVLETIRRPSRRLRREIVDRLVSRKRDLDGLEGAAEYLSEADADKLYGYTADLGLLAKRLASGATAAELLVVVRDRIGLGANLATLDASKASPDAAHLDDLDALIAVAGAHDQSESFEAWLRTHLVPSGGEPDGVLLASVHKVKGLEFERVVVVGVNDGMFPHRLADDTEEERRVFHVAITRAVEELVLVADEDNPSEFVAQLDRFALKQRRDKTAGATPRGAKPRHSLETPAAEADEAVVEALKDWRRTLAVERGVPAYVILHDKHLMSIAVRLPATLDELAACDGIGPRRLEDYGDDIVAALDTVRIL